MGMSYGFNDFNGSLTTNSRYLMVRYFHVFFFGFHADLVPKTGECHMGFTMIATQGVEFNVSSTITGTTQMVNN
jgi:hypothetical protein